MEARDLPDLEDAPEGDDEPEEEDPEQYLNRFWDGLEPLRAKVNLKLAKLQRQKARIFWVTLVQHGRLRSAPGARE
jgi:hypothetical protein